MHGNTCNITQQKAEWDEVISSAWDRPDEGVIITQISMAWMSPFKRIRITIKTVHPHVTCFFHNI